MKRTALGLFAVLSFLLALGVAAASAQERMIRGNIPFNFTVGKTNLPAGEYEANPVSKDGTWILIRSTDGKSSAMFQTSEAKANGEVRPRLVFIRYGSRSILTQLWMGNGWNGRQLAKTHLALELAKNESAASEVTIAASLR